MANPRVSQNVTEAAIEPSEVKARISQETLDVVILPTSSERVSQSTIEVVNNLYELVTAAGTITPTATLANEVLQLDDWLARRVAKRIFLVKLTLRYASGGSVATDILYLSNHAYNTRADEDPANTEYIAVLRDDGLPTFRQELSDTFWGISMPSFGGLVISNADGQFDAKLPPSRQWEGGEVEVKMTGDRSELDLADAVVLLKGVMG
ncbi:MAG: hypothetical protein Q8R16_03155, partial [bacterium]|nr:hypothetical protein [bacterium]